MTEPGGPSSFWPDSDGRRASADLETLRLDEARAGRPWKRWGPYLAERQWGTVREDYSAAGNPWTSFDHDQARRRAYRWGEDGLLGISDDAQRLCLAVAVWNERDPILKERLFGLTNDEGNHGEDVKELYFYLDALPTSSYLRAAYVYPQRAFPYADLVEQNARGGPDQPEYELLDTGVLDDDRAFDVEVVYAKAAPEAIVMRLRATNHGPDAAPIHLLPTVWFRNSWSWSDPAGPRPQLRADGAGIVAEHADLGRFRIAARARRSLRWLFTENDSGPRQESEPAAGAVPSYTKDAFHRLLIDGDERAVNPAGIGTKAAAHARWVVAPGHTVELRVAIVAEGEGDPADLLREADRLITRRAEEADAFYGALAHPTMNDEERRIQRQAMAGMLWSLQYYEYDVARWRSGDSLPPQAGHAESRNRGWGHLRAHDILAMPDAWEYPWFASWDLAFHAVTLGLVDPDRAKDQLLALLDDRYLHPDGQMPAYEWEFSDLNPPLQAWAALRVFRRDALMTRRRDRAFLERMLHGLALNFGWWVNRKDARGVNVFDGGFLGLDNISLVDRSAPSADGARVEQADATGWMAFFALGLTEMALELAVDEPVYMELAKHFLGRFVAIGDALAHVGGEGLWDDDERFFFDRMRRADGSIVQLRAFSVASLIPLFAVRVVEPGLLESLPEFTRHLEHLASEHPRFFGPCECFLAPNEAGQRLVALIDEHRLIPILDRVLDETRFLSPYGVRSLSRLHADARLPVDVDLGAGSMRVRYEPGEAATRIKGGNSNWRGPVWFPINYLLVQALRQYGRYYGPRVSHAMPAPDGEQRDLAAIGEALARRLIGLFATDGNGARPASGGDARWRDRPFLRDRLLFHEYFHGESGKGLGASHQTGWTALVANLIDEVHRPRRAHGLPAAETGHDRRVSEARA